MKLDRSIYIPRPETADLQEIRREELGAVCYTFTNSRGKPCAMGFAGKRAKPSFHYSYLSEERRDKAVSEFFEGQERAAAYKAEQAAARRAASAKRSALTFEGETYLSAADCAALLRQTLKESFPGTRFSVTSDRCLRVAWTDGPSAKAVERIAQTFAGSYFDGMIDYKGSIYHELDGRQVSFGCDFVTVSREMSAEALELGRAAYEAAAPGHAGAVSIDPTGGYAGGPVVHVNEEHPHVIKNIYHESTIAEPKGCAGTRFSGAAAHALTLWHDQAHPVEPQPSATLARIRVLGSDGYGNTALDAADGGETGRGYPRQKPSEETAERVATVEETEREVAAALLVDSFFAELTRRAEAGELFPVAPAEETPKRSAEIINFADYRRLN